MGASHNMISIAWHLTCLFHSCNLREFSREGENMKKFGCAFLITATLFLVGCHGTQSGNSTYYGNNGYYDPGYSGWYNVYGQSCGTLKPGCNYWSDGLKIVDIEDPYYGSAYYWDYYYDYYYGQYVWVSPSGLIYNDWGNCLNRAGSNSISRDLITIVSDEEEKTIQSAAKNFAAKYSLSAETSTKVARTMNDWAKLGFQRGNKGRTAQDVADFTKRLYGVDIQKVSTALMSAAIGDESDLNNTVNEVAANWGTNPETMREILKDFHGKQLDGVGITLE
jgi:hypothetical protein